jgi:hypothetical protein
MDRVIVMSQPEKFYPCATRISLTNEGGDKQSETSPKLELHKHMGETPIIGGRPIDSPFSMRWPGKPRCEARMNAAKI